MKERLNLEEELSLENLSKFIEGLQLVLSSSEQLSETSLCQFRANLREMEQLARYIGKQSKDYFDKDRIVMILSIKEFTNVLMSMEPMKPYLSRLLKIRDNLSKFTSKFSIEPLFEDVILDESSLSENLEGKTKDELFEHFANQEIKRVVKYYNDREREEIKQKAKDSVMDYLYSHGETKIIKPTNLEEELQLAIKEAHDSIMERTNYVIKLNENLPKEELSENEKLSDYLSKVSDIVLKAEKEKKDK